MSNKMTTRELIASFSEEEKDRVRKRLGVGGSEETPRPISVNIHFPEKLGLESFSFSGLVPSKGDVFYVRPMGIMGEEPEYSYRKVARWRVKEIGWSCMVPSSQRESLLYGSHVHVEVYLKPDRYWRFFHRLWWQCVGRFSWWLAKKMMTKDEKERMMEHAEEEREEESRKT